MEAITVSDAWEDQMIDILKSNERGHSNHGWLESYHTFSFAEYYNPNQMQFGSLRVINEDRVQPGQGFGKHGHKDMEIISYVLSGALNHQDSMGNGSTIVPGDIQRMTAGSGILHSESNGSGNDPVHFLQIWVLPNRMGLTPGYEQKHFSDEDKKNMLCLLGSSDGRNGSLTIHQDVFFYGSLLEDESVLKFPLREGRMAFVQVVRGGVNLNGEILKAGDGAKILNEGLISLKGLPDAEILLFDMV